MLYKRLVLGLAMASTMWLVSCNSNRLEIITSLGVEVQQPLAGNYILSAEDGRAFLIARINEIFLLISEKFKLNLKKADEQLEIDHFSGKIQVLSNSSRPFKLKNQFFSLNIFPGSGAVIQRHHTSELQVKITGRADLLQNGSTRSLKDEEYTLRLPPGTPEKTLARPEYKYVIMLKNGEKIRPYDIKLGHEELVLVSRHRATRSISLKEVAAITSPIKF